MGSFLYKYRDVTNVDLDKCYNLQNLINNQATISSRKLFNDPYDSRVYFEKPTLDEFKQLRKQLKGEDLRRYKLCLNTTGFTKYANTLFEELEETFNSMIDKYGIYCLTKNSTNDAMWAHYTKNHEGFCIKFKAEPFEIEKVEYADNIHRVKLFSLLKAKFKRTISDEETREIVKGLLTKKRYWEYEQEYRFTMSGKLVGTDFILKPYLKDSVEAVIFGYKMKSEVKRYIIEKTDFTFLQAVLGKKEIEIVNFDEKKHLK